MPTYLNSLLIKNYRGIDDQAQIMPAFKDFNFFIGSNNAGKSTVLNFISRYLPPIFRDTVSIGREKNYNIDALERHGGAASAPIQTGIGFKADDLLTALSKNHDRLKSDSISTQLLKEILTGMEGDFGLIWKYSDVPYADQFHFGQSLLDLKHLGRQQDWQRLWMLVTHYTGGGGMNDWATGIATAIDKASPITLPAVHIIPAIRQIGPSGGEFSDYSGKGLIDRLAAAQNPEHNRRNDREKFDAINGFLQYVTDRPDAVIEIPYSREHVLVNMDGRVLPISSLGTGIHEVIMIAAFCTLSDESIICIEEPEIHLHPLLQRKLIKHLSDFTSNQYFIATHSASFIDTPGAAIFHVYQENSKTRIREAILKQERYAICIDLGHRASDIIQANFVIWVEGPSDRIYLNHWLNIAAPDFVEGVQYAIMFYGGRLLSHLSAEDEEVSEFIQLRDLNRNAAILMDSDRISSHARVNDTKKRIKEGFEGKGNIAWITKGREVENYIEHSRLQKAVASVYGANYGKALSGGPYDHALEFERSVAKKSRSKKSCSSLIETKVDKVKVSRAVASDGVDDLDVLDLRERVYELVKHIRDANR